MIKVIKFLILGIIIIHLSDASASVNTKLKGLIKTDMSLSEFVDTAQAATDSKKRDIKFKVSLIRAFNEIDKNGDLEIDSYEYLTMN